MKRISAAVGACLVALLIEGCADMQPSKTAAVSAREFTAKGEPQKLAILDTDLKTQLALFMQLRQKLFTQPVADCEIGTGGTCTISIQLARVTDANGVNYCVGLLPESVGLSGAGPDNERTIIWSLILPDPAISTSNFYFYGEKDHGITWLTDKDQQFSGGRLGDGSGGPANPKKWHAKNKHDTRSSVGVYVPIILEEDIATGKISLCGTPDPKILND